MPPLRLPSTDVETNGAIDAALLDAYLRRMQVDAEPPSADALFRLHRAHVDRIPYETTWIHLGEQWSVDTDAAVERIARGGRGGYCFHLNGSLARLLSTLGYDVTLHIGGVHGPDPGENDLTNHLVLLVRGLPTTDNPTGDWYVDAGLGDALYEPLPLQSGSYEQTPMTFALSETPGGIGDWHFDHDPAGSFPGMNFRSTIATIDDFAPRHQVLSSSPDSGFVRTVTAQRRRPDRVSALRAFAFKTIDASGSQTTFVTDRNEWLALLADEFLLPLDGVDREAKDRLWGSAQMSHEEWITTQ
jgi:N-hydroxyarylamine O-acetyltransferase